jgi:hypothetical protein
MALLVADCPHCSTTKSGMSVFGSRLWPKEFKSPAGHDAYKNPFYRWDIGIAAQCQTCHLPVAARVRGGSPHHDYNYDAFAKAVTGQLLGSGNVADLGFQVLGLWPKPVEPSVPAHVPAAVERAMLQAERNYPIKGNEEAAAMMYRRALELTLGDLHSELKGTLAARIKKLVSQQVLPSSIGDWADEIRELGNEAAHDPEDVSRDQLRMIRGFADAILRYLYTLPAEVAARRKTPANAEGD